MFYWVAPVRKQGVFFTRNPKKYLVKKIERKTPEIVEDPPRKVRKALPWKVSHLLWLVQTYTCHGVSQGFFTHFWWAPLSRLRVKRNIARFHWNYLNPTLTIFSTLTFLHMYFSLQLHPQTKDLDFWVKLSAWGSERGVSGRRVILFESGSQEHTDDFFGDFSCNKIQTPNNPFLKILKRKIGNRKVKGEIWCFTWVPLWENNLFFVLETKQQKILLKEYDETALKLWSILPGARREPGPGKLSIFCGVYTHVHATGFYRVFSLISGLPPFLACVTKRMSLGFIGIIFIDSDAFPPTDIPTKVFFDRSGLKKKILTFEWNFHAEGGEGCPREGKDDLKRMIRRSQPIF